MKGLLVLGLGLFVAGFWITLIACVGRDKAEIHEPAGESCCQPPTTDALLEVKFPREVVEPNVSVPITQEEESSMHKAQEGMEDHSSSFLSNPETWDRIAEMERKAALPKTYEDRVLEVRSLAATHMAAGAILSKDELAFLVKEAENGWGGDMQTSFRYWAETFGYELLPLGGDTTSPE